MNPDSLERVRSWLHACVAEAVAGLPAVRRWAPDEGGFGATVRIELESGVVRLSARPPDEHPAWLDKPSVAVNATCEPMPAPPRLHAFLSTMRALLQAAADPSPGTPSASPPPSAARARDALLHKAAFYAHQILRHEPRVLPEIERHDGAAIASGHTLVLQEYYPYVGALGVPTPVDVVRDGWRQTVARIRSGQAPPGLGVYVHVPFCTTRCRFCFCSMTDTVEGKTMTAYVDALVEELHAHGALVDGVPVTSVFVGGGTPSLLPRLELARLFAALRSAFAIPSSTQLTMETNPDSLTVEKIELLATQAGVTRLTLGVQSLDPETQRRANRFNDPGRVRALARAIRDAGLILHMDIMAGMDGQTFEAFQRDVELALSLQPDSLHLSPFRPVGADGRADPQQVELRRRMMRWGDELLESEGLRAHLGFPRSRREEAVNAQLVEWRDQVASLLPIGVAAYGNSFGSHAYQVSAHARMPGIDAAVSRLVRREARTVDAFAMDVVEEAHRFLVHTLLDGFSLSWFRRYFGCDPWDLRAERWALLEELGALSVEGDRVVSHVRNQADKCLYGALLYGPRVEEAIERRWGAEYDPTHPYADWVREVSLGAS